MNPTEILTHLGDLPVDTFLAEYWQKKPLYIPNALPDLPQIDPNELAGFALEDDIESRLIIETPGEDPMQSQWQVQHGPLDEAVFGSLPEQYWSLLIQAVDQLDPRLHQLLQRFRFIPGWRLDDIMVSYAPDQGGVGPHFDYYDVFLLQASGKRRWHIGQTCDHASPLLTGAPLKILTHFETRQTFETKPGDLLYIPPQVAHWGAALGESVTYSVGFRAPSHSDILSDFAQEVASQLNEDQRYSDAGLSPAQSPAAITRADLARVRAILDQYLNDDSALLEWFGRYMTEPRRSAPGFAFEPATESETLHLNPGSRIAWHGDVNPVKLFVDGQVYTASRQLAETLGRREPIDAEQFSSQDQTVIAQLSELGVFD